MANDEHVALLKQGVAAWNKWRDENPSTRPNLYKADLSGANLMEANLIEANFSGAHLFKADLSGANLFRTRLSGANLIEANLDGANLIEANFSWANLYRADLSTAILVGTNFSGADLTGCCIYALRDELRKRNYLPILFDFNKPTSRTTDETITLLARMSRFVFADISDAKSVLQELRAIVPNLPSVPVQPVITAMQEEPGMFDFFRQYPWFLKVHHYASQQQLIADLGERVIGPAEKGRRRRPRPRLPGS
jgi:hypothetical protein